MPNALWAVGLRSLKSPFLDLVNHGQEWGRSVGSGAEHPETPLEEVEIGAEKMGLARLSQT